MSDSASLEIHPEDRRLQAEIEDLRARHVDTQELYREVCVLLFFRHGITPTANKLYQLVRKGSMSAPAEALSRFWEILREKSRVRIEHPDLPEELRDAAGEVIGALWLRAQASASEGFTAERSEAQAAVVAAAADMEAAQAHAEAAEKANAKLQTDLSVCQTQLQETGQALAREQGTRVGLERQLQAGEQQRRELQQALDAARQGFERQLEEQRAAAAASSERHQADLRRALLDVDRERSGATKLAKDLEQVRKTTEAHAEQHRVRMAELQQELGQLRQRLGATEGALAEARSASEALRTQLDKRLEAKAPRKTTTRKSP
ncbi:DNA-binding protein [Variovorax sp. ZS18.2.2]|uniref:DNA-binding protein n=1 Tax=Variovorax sp. ZS18.2.2 TaxID=2971255 RepID=UPI0021519774|nr:DNA-binding protein [Variovorax sp. ZS18.2.2]MCR6475969.1 DNA-binding protein [Variovorax sp. ZS18.2.2]